MFAVRLSSFTALHTFTCCRYRSQIERTMKVRNSNKRGNLFVIGKVNVQCSTYRTIRILFTGLRFPRNNYKNVWNS